MLLLQRTELVLGNGLTILLPSDQEAHEVLLHAFAEIAARGRWWRLCGVCAGEQQGDGQENRFHSSLLLKCIWIALRISLQRTAKIL